MNIGDIIKEMCARDKWSGRGINPTAKIVSDYLEIVVDNILNGYEVKLPKDFGTIGIYKNELKNGQMPNISKSLMFQQGKKEISYNSKTVGYYYTIEMESPVLEKFGFNFEAGSTLRKRLTDLLIEKNCDYILK